jgi:hypothetical protein
VIDLAGVAEGQEVAVQVEVISALARDGLREVAPEDPFLPLIDNVDPKVRSLARESVARLGPRAKRAGARIAKGLRHSDDLGLVDPLPVENLGPALKDAVPLLRVSLRNDRTLNQHALLKLLGRMGPDAREAVPELLALARRNDFRTSSALDALAAIRPPAKEVLPIAVAALDFDEFDRYAALRLLGVYGPEAGSELPAVKALLRIPSPKGRAWAAAAAIKIAGDAAPYLPQLTQDLKVGVIEGDIGFVLEYLAPAAPDVLPAALERLPWMSPGGQTAALRGAARYGPAAKGAVPVLIQELTRTDVNPEFSIKVLACEALGAIGPVAKEALPVLKGMKDTPGWKLARAVDRAIARIEADR